MYIDPRPIHPAKTELVPARGRLLPVLAFALCSVLAMAGTVLLGQSGVAVPECGLDPASTCSGP